MVDVLTCPACGFDPYDMIFYAIKQEFPDNNPRDVIEEMYKSGEYKTTKVVRVSLSKRQVAMVPSKKMKSTSSSSESIIVRYSLSPIVFIVWLKGKLPLLESAKSTRSFVR